MPTRNELLVRLCQIERDAERLHDLAGRRDDTSGADDRRDGREDPLDLLGTGAAFAGNSEVHQIRGGWSVDCDERGDANKHQRLGVEARRLGFMVWGRQTYRQLTRSWKLLIERRREGR